MNAVNQKLAEGKLVLCMGLRQARTVDVAMIAAAAGFDAVFVDMEHSSVSLETASTICASCHSLGITPLVRVPGHASEWVSRVLDGGAQGVIAPHVNDAGEARAIVNAARFPPVGHRSVMGTTPALAYKAMPQKEIATTLNRDTLLIVMLETPRAIENADEIAAVAGVDMLLMGSNDLSTELGIPGEYRNPKMQAAFEAAARACKAHGKTLGIGGIRGDLDLQRDLLRLGARFFIAGSDVSYLTAAAKKDVEALRGLT